MSAPDPATALAGHGLRVLGQCATVATDPVPAGRRLVLVGPDEPGFWPIFTASPEYSDTAPDPMDRWSVRVLSAVAQQTGAEALFPFGGPPFLPFQSWAVRSGQCWSSPIRFLVHAQAGLFVSYRGALLYPDLPETPAAAPATKPCETCAGQPCRSACPVDAFADGYDVAACKAHVRSPAGLSCRTGGCLARRACPVGQGRRLPAQSAFHMETFL